MTVNQTISGGTLSLDPDSTALPNETTRKLTQHPRPTKGKLHDNKKMNQVLEIEDLSEHEEEDEEEHKKHMHDKDTMKGSCTKGVMKASLYYNRKFSKLDEQL